MATASAAFVALSTALANQPDANAAIFSLNDSHSWATGTDTIERVLGFKMVRVPDDSHHADLQFISTLASPLGNLTFTSPVQKRNVPETWETWTHGYDGSVYFTGGIHFMNIDLPARIGAFDLYVEPNRLAIFDIEVTAVDGIITTVTQAVRGDSGAKYYGFYTTDGDVISGIRVLAPRAAEGFAAGEFRLASVPKPKQVPEPSSNLGVISIGLLGLLSATGLGTRCMLKWKQGGRG